jgi:hypothetical protein
MSYPDGRPSHPLQATASRAERWMTATAIALAVADWRIFFPGLMSMDSVQQYAQARAGLFNDWHPPFMAFVLHVVLSFGAGLGLLMLGQCVAGVLGIRALARATLAAVFGERLSPVARGWIAVGCVAVLLIPVTPLAFYLMTFWKDAWALVLLAWICALATELLAVRGRLGGPGESFQLPAARRRYLCRIAALVALGVMLTLTRHNAVVVLPALGTVLWRCASSRGRSVAAALAMSPLILWFAADRGLTAGLRVKPMRPDAQVMVLDLVGLCARSRATCDALPWTRAHLRDRSSLAAYRPGDAASAFSALAGDPYYLFADDYPELRREYLGAWRRFPGQLTRVKLSAFTMLLGLSRTEYFFHDSIADNPFGLALRPRAAPVRAWLSAAADETARTPRRWVAGVHLIWLTVDLIGILAALVLAQIRRESKWLDVAVVLTLPLAYFLSYLPATPVHDFRLMYPATAAVQCATLATTLGALVGRWSALRPARSVE